MNLILSTTGFLSSACNHTYSHTYVYLNKYTGRYSLSCNVPISEEDVIMIKLAYHKTFRVTGAMWADGGIEFKVC